MGKGSLVTNDIGLELLDLASLSAVFGTPISKQLDFVKILANFWRWLN